MITSTTISKIAAALVNAQAEMENATKGSKNPFFKSTYADLNAIREVALPALNKHKIVALQPTVVIDGKKYVQTTLMHETGEFISGITEILSVKENDAQAQGSGISYARRYGLSAILNVGAEDDDGNAASGNIKPLIRDNKPLNDMMKDVGKIFNDAAVVKKTVAQHTFTLPDKEKEKSVGWIKQQLAKQPNWQMEWKVIMKKITGVDSVQALSELPHESLTEITKLLLTTYKIED